MAGINNICLLVFVQKVLCISGLFPVAGTDYTLAPNVEHHSLLGERPTSVFPSIIVVILNEKHFSHLHKPSELKQCERENKSLVI